MSAYVFVMSSRLTRDGIEKIGILNLSAPIKMKVLSYLMFVYVSFGI